MSGMETCWKMRYPRRWVSSHIRGTMVSWYVDLPADSPLASLMALQTPNHRRAPPSGENVEPLAARNDAHRPTMVSRSMLGSSESAQIEAVKRPETPSWTAKRLTESELSPEAKVRSSEGMCRIPSGHHQFA